MKIPIRNQSPQLCAEISTKKFGRIAGKPLVFEQLWRGIKYSHSNSAVATSQWLPITN